MQKLEELDVEQFLVDMKEREKWISELRTELESKVDEQKNRFMTYAKKMIPIINYYKSNDYRFNHPSFNYVSSRGPVLNYDASEQKLFVFEPEGAKIISISINKSDEIQNVPASVYFGKYNYEVAMEGLESTLTMHEDIEKIFKDEISKKQTEISKFL